MMMQQAWASVHKCTITPQPPIPLLSPSLQPRTLDRMDSLLPSWEMCAHLFTHFFSKDFRAPIPDSDDYETIVIKVDVVFVLMEYTLQWWQLRENTKEAQLRDLSIQSQCEGESNPTYVITMGYLNDNTSGSETNFPQDHTSPKWQSPTQSHLYSGFWILTLPCSSWVPLDKLINFTVPQFP